MRRISLFLITVCATLIGKGQTNTNFAWQERSSTLSGGLEIGIPLGEYDFTWGANTFGLSANVALPMRVLPLDIGYDFGWSRMGSEYGEPLNASGLLSANTGREVRVKSNVYNHHLLLRLNPLRGRIRPYGDLMMGARHFSTRSIASAANGESEEERDGAFAGSAGWAVGTMVSLSRQIYVEARVERLFSGKVSYVDPRTITIANDGSVTYEKLTSRTDVVNVQLGVGLRF
ncbi:MAG: hypothetical protein IPH63_10265 [Flavobacteriales bacterium]|nr:hypothetical protein [Flavobacteriales bacterium]